MIILPPGWADLYETEVLWSLNIGDENERNS